MNRRIKKKLKIRMGHRHYKDARIAKLQYAIRQKYPDTSLIILQTTKRGVVKRIFAAQGPVYPTSASLYKPE